MTRANLKAVAALRVQGLTQAQIAEKMGVTERTVQRWLARADVKALINHHREAEAEQMLDRFRANCVAGPPILADIAEGHDKRAAVSAIRASHDIWFRMDSRMSLSDRLDKLEQWRTETGEDGAA